MTTNKERPDDDDDDDDIEFEGLVIIARVGGLVEEGTDEVLISTKGRATLLGVGPAPWGEPAVYFSDRYQRVYVLDYHARRRVLIARPE